MSNGHGRHQRGLARVEELSAVVAEVGLVLGQAPADLDDRLAQLDGALPADVLTGPGSPG